MSSYSQRIKVKYTLFLILSCATLFVHQFVPAYHPIGPQLLTNDTFSYGNKGWTLHESEYNKIHIKPGVVTLKSVTSDKTISLSQTVDNKKLHERVLFKATVKSRYIEKGKNSWNKGRILLVQYLNKDIVWNINHTFISIDQTTEWQTVSKVFKIHEWSNATSVNIQMSKSTGSFFCKDLALYNAVPSPIYTILRYCSLALWVLFIGFLLRPYFLNNSSSRKLIPLLTTITVVSIMVGVTLPSSIKSAAKAKIDSQVSQYKNTISNHAANQIGTFKNNFKLKTPKIDITKIAHFGLFAILTFFLCWQNRPSGYIETINILLDILLLACATELSQFYIEGRSPLFSDIGIDMTGCLFGLFLYLTSYRIKRQRLRTWNILYKPFK